MTEPLYFPGALDQVYQMDALELLKVLPPESVNAFILDLPYGTTACSWDEIIPFEPMWAGVKRVLKPRGVFVTTASQPFTSKLVMSNVSGFKYSWVWVKNKITGFANAPKQPLRRFEDVLVFGGGAYYPQGLQRVNITRRNGVSAGGSSLRGELTGNAGKGKLRTEGSVYVQEWTNYPDNVLFFDCETFTEHGTQKPVALFRYLIRTYTQPGDLVVDFCCGSGTTALAAREEGRRFIVGDTSPEYVAIARERLAQPHTLSFMNILDSVDKDAAACPNLSNSKVIPK